MTYSLILQLDSGVAQNKIDPLVLSFDQGTIAVEGLEHRDSFGPLVFDARVERHRAHGSAYRSVLANFLRQGYAVRDEARAYVERTWSPSTSQTPYPHQTEALDAWVKAGKRGVVVLPTGAGKTYVAQLAMEATGRSTLIVVPTLDLVSQWVSRMEAVFGGPVGMLGGGAHEIQDVTVSTYDSAAIHMDRLGDRFGLVVFDEVHHLPGDMYRRAAQAAIAPFRLGLTATPERSDGRHAHLTDLVGPLVFERGIKDLSGDILADYEVRTLEIPMDPEDFQRYTEARKVYRDFVDDKRISMRAPQGWQRFLAATNRSAEGRQALGAYHEQKRIALVHRNKLARLFELLEEHDEERVIIFTNDNATVYRISEQMLCPCITHETGLKERREILERFNAGVYRAVATSKVLNEGVDVPMASVAVVLAGSGSVREHVQRLGRILRRGEGKKAILYELVTADSVETYVSQRRREHDAYK